MTFLSSPYTIIKLDAYVDTAKIPLQIGQDLGNREVTVHYFDGSGCFAAHADRWDLAMLPGWEW